MSTAARIRFLRLREGKSAQQMATDLGLNEAWYSDLESSDDELAATLTMFQAQQLASLLGVRLHDLLAESTGSDEKIALLDLPAMVAAHIAREAISIEEFEERLGWELQEFLESPVKVAAALPIVFLQALSRELGIHWLSLLPEEELH